MKDFKEKCEKATRFIESCWDENNPGDGLTFDERLEKRARECDDQDIKEILGMIDE